MIWTAFLIGLLGSAHCIGMCGPIALALPVPASVNRYVGIALYNAGRISLYTLLGLLLGGIGHLVVIAGFQQFLSIVGGICLLLLTLFYLIGKKSIGNIVVLTRSISFLKRITGEYLKRFSLSSLFVIGFLNGLLPCGMVYMAVIGAITTGSILQGGLYMLLFGLGTAPAMMMVAILKNNVSFSLRQRLRKILPYSIGVVGLLLVFRGLNLGVPYLSPALSHENKAGCCTTTVKCH